MRYSNQRLSEIDLIAYPSCTRHAICVHQSKPIFITMLKPSCVSHPLDTFQLYCCIHQQCLHIPPTQARPGGNRKEGRRESYREVDEKEDRKGEMEKEGGRKEG